MHNASAGCSGCLLAITSPGKTCHGGKPGLLQKHARQEDTSDANTLMLSIYILATRSKVRRVPDDDDHEAMARRAEIGCSRQMHKLRLTPEPAP